MNIFLSPVEVILSLIVICLLAVVGFQVLRSSGSLIIPPVIPSEGVKVPVRIARRGGYLWGIHNNAFPSLTLYEDKIEYRVVFKGVKFFGEIQEVGVFNPIFDYNLVVLPKARDRVMFYGPDLYFGVSKSNLKILLSYFQGRGISLSENAKKFLNQNGI